MTLADDVCALFDTRGVAHALIGAAALAAAGVVRSTLDLDVLTLDARVLERAFWQDLGVHNAEIDLRRGDEHDPLAGVIRITAPAERPVDVIIGRHRWQQRAIERAKQLPDGRRVVQPHDLVLLKLYAGGAQDLWDIEQLLVSTDEAELIAHVERDLASLPPDAAVAWRTLVAKRRA